MGMITDITQHFLDKPVAAYTTTRLNTAPHFITTILSFIQNLPQTLKEQICILGI
jgi:hypothetical protein